MAQHANRSCSVRENQLKNLLTDEVPSFNLGLTQDEVFNLGSTNVFSKEGVTIEELRSKHRNDPEKIVEIMKRKGFTKTSSPTKFQKSVKRKKSDEKGECSKIATLVASDSESEQEKVDEVIRDQIFMARVLPKFAPHIGCHMVNDIKDRIKTMLTKSQESSTSVIVIRAKGTILHFTIREFALVTGLNCATNKDEFVFDEERPNIIIDQYFDGESFVQKKDLYAVVSNKIWGNDNDEDALKFANLYFIHAFLLSSDDTVAIPRLHFDLVESGRYSDYPWGSVAFEESARSLHKKLKPKGKFYMLLGMPLTIQIWLYECCSSVPRNVASKVDSQIPRILNWKTNSPRPRYETLMGSMFDDTDDKSPAPSSFSSEDEDGVVSKKVFDKFCEKKQAKGNESDQPPADENAKSTSPHQATTKFVHEFNKNPEGTLVDEEVAGYQSNSMNDVYTEINGYNEDNDIVLITKSVDESIGEAQISESQLTFPNDVLRSIDLDSITKANVEVEDEFKNKEGAIEMNVNTPAGHESEVNDVDNSKLDQQYKSAVHIPAGVNVESNVDQHLSDSQNTLPNELLSSINAIIDCNFMNIVTTVFDVYKLEDATLNVGGKKYHLNEYVSGFHMYATVSWHTVNHMFIPVHIKAKHHWVLAVISFNHRCIYVYDSLSAAGHDEAVLIEIENLAKVIPICLIKCKFYENKGIDIDNHPNYKLNDKMDPFGVSIVENVPQQPSGSLNCGLYMVAYAECLTFGEAVPCIDFDPDLIRIRYASLLWDYGTRKANAKAQNDDEAPMRPLRITELTEGTEVVDI
ncbi:hypothetical protein FXO37_03253 [Capsicum annuum]|nr:hypothetical protein FXO37_03253 [Capsicum annuum]